MKRAATALGVACVLGALAVWHGYRPRAVRSRAARGVELPLRSQAIAGQAAPHVRPDALRPSADGLKASGGAPSGAAGSGDGLDDDDAEDEAMRAADELPEQRVWRAVWAQEQPDAQWAQRVIDEVTRTTRQQVEGDVQLRDLSCRETVCRMYLQFADQLDAEAFRAAPHDPMLQYAYQSLDPAFDGAGFDRSNHTYELLIKRPRAGYVSPQPSAYDSDDSELAASESHAGREPADAPSQPRVVIGSEL